VIELYSFELQDRFHQEEFEAAKKVGLRQVLFLASAILSDAEDMEDKKDRDLHIEDARKMISYVMEKVT